MQVGRLCRVLSTSSDDLYEHTATMFASSKKRMLSVAYGPLPRAEGPAAQAGMQTSSGRVRFTSE